MLEKHAYALLFLFVLESGTHQLKQQQLHDGGVKTHWEQIAHFSAECVTGK